MRPCVADAWGREISQSRHGCFLSKSEVRGFASCNTGQPGSKSCSNYASYDIIPCCFTWEKERDLFTKSPATSSCRAKFSCTVTAYASWNYPCCMRPPPCRAAAGASVLLQDDAPFSPLVSRYLKPTFLVLGDVEGDTGHTSARTPKTTHEIQPWLVAVGGVASGTSSDVVDRARVHRSLRPTLMTTKCSLPFPQKILAAPIPHTPWLLVVFAFCCVCGFSSVKEMVGKHGVVVYSKSYCPYCTKAKKALNEIGAKYELIELDQVENGSAVQDALQSITGQRSVPNVFIGGTSIGGGDDTVKLKKSGELLTKVTAAGAV